MYISHAPSTRADQSYTLNAVRAEVDAHMRGIFREILAWWGTPANMRPASCHWADKSATGSSKSTAFCNALVEYIPQARVRGLPSQVRLIVPHHRLSNQLQTELQKRGLRVYVRRGREAQDPRQTGKPMCWALDRVTDTLRIGANPRRAVCGSGRPGEPSCEYNGRCGYTLALTNEETEIAAADVVIVTSYALFADDGLDEASIALTVMDEAWWTAALVADQEVAIEHLAEEVRRAGRQSGWSGASIRMRCAGVGRRAGVARP